MKAPGWGCMGYLAGKGTTMNTCMPQNVAEASVQTIQDLTTHDSVVSAERILPGDFTEILGTPPACRIRWRASEPGTVR